MLKTLGLLATLLFASQSIAGLAFTRRKFS